MQFERFTPTSILVPVDDVFGAGSTLRLVERLAAAARARVTLLHVLPTVTPAVSHDSTSLNLATAHARASRHEAESSLWALTDQLRGHGLEATSVIEMGDPAAVILRETGLLRVDLLVMGTHSSPVAERLLFGSVAETVVRRAQVPILFVPPGVAAWRASQPVNVLTTLDGSPLAERALPFGLGFSRLFDGDLHLLRVANRPDTATATAYLEEVTSAVRGEAMPRVRGCVITGASAGEGIRQYAHDNDVGLIALASHGRGGLSRAVLGSVAMDILTRATVPIVVVPPRAHVPRGTSAECSQQNAHGS